MTTFGVSFDDHIQSMNVQVPVIVTKCVQEIDKRGLDIKVRALPYGCGIHMHIKKGILRV